MPKYHLKASDRHSPRVATAGYWEPLDFRPFAAHRRKECEMYLSDDTISNFPSTDFRALLKFAP